MLVHTCFLLFFTLVSDRACENDRGNKKLCYKQCCWGTIGCSPEASREALKPCKFTRRAPLVIHLPIVPCSCLELTFKVTRALALINCSNFFFSEKGNSSPILWLRGSICRECLVLWTYWLWVVFFIISMSVLTSLCESHRTTYLNPATFRCQRNS